MTETNVLKGKFNKLGKRLWSKRVKYLFLLPAVVWFFIFSYIPLAGLIIVFKNYSYTSGILGSPNTQPLFKYFTMFFDNPMLLEMIRNTVLISVLKLLTGFPAPIILAISLSEVGNKYFKRVVQTVSYFPFFISWVIVMTMLDQLLTPYGAGGPLYKILQTLTGKEDIMFYLIDKNYFYPLVILSNIWKTIGWNSIIYLAAITNINPELYEAAKIDGAGRVKTIFKITLPSISNSIGLLFILALGGLISAGYEQIYLMQQPTNYEWSNVLDVFIITEGLNQGKYSLAAVAGLFQGLIALALVVTGNLVLKKTVDISLW